MRRESDESFRRKAENVPPARGIETSQHVIDQNRQIVLALAKWWGRHLKNREPIEQIVTK